VGTHNPITVPLPDGRTITLDIDQARKLRAHINAGLSGKSRWHTERCPCGAMAASRAKARNHKCEAPK
jgi:hypothetical protein